LRRGRHDGFGQTEVHQLGPGAGQHDVARLQVAVDDARAVRLVEALGDPSAIPHHLLDRKASLGETGSQRLALQVFHNDVVDPVLLAEVIELADVGVAELRDGARLALETLTGLRLFR